MSARNTSVTHLTDGKRHLVVVDSLSVIIGREAGYWYAQGIQIDYVASADSFQNVKAVFEKGLSETIRLNIQRFGTIDKIMKFAPQSEWGDIQFNFVEEAFLPESAGPIKKITYVEPTVQ